MIALFAALALQAAPETADAGNIPATLPEPPIVCAGEHRQGAMLVCRTAPNAEVTLGESAVVGYLTIDALVRVVERVPFAPVCFTLGALAIVGGGEIAIVV